MIEYQRVERDVALHTAPVQRAHNFRQFVEPKPDLGPRREMLQPEVHRIGACFDGRAQLGPISRRTHDFRFTADGHGEAFFKATIRRPIPESSRYGH